MSYHVEWRVINAADYGMPQQRREFLFLHIEIAITEPQIQTENQIMDAERLALEDQ